MVLVRWLLSCHPPWVVEGAASLSTPAHRRYCSRELDSCFQLTSMSRTRVRFSQFGTIAH